MSLGELIALIKIKSGQETHAEHTRDLIKDVATSFRDVFAPLAEAAAGPYRPLVGAVKESMLPSYSTLRPNPRSFGWALDALKRSFLTLRRGPKEFSGSVAVNQTRHRKLRSYKRYYWYFQAVLYVNLAVLGTAEILSSGMVGPTYLRSFVRNRKPWSAQFALGRMQLSKETVATWLSSLSHGSYEHHHFELVEL